MAMSVDAPVDRTATIPVWRQIEIDLAWEIGSGLLSPGQKLRSEQALSEAYGVNRHTVRMALAKLAADRLVVAHRGKGVFVCEQPPEYLLNRDAKWSEVERRHDSAPGGQLIGTYRRTASSRIAGLLGVAEGSALIVTETVRTAAIGLSTYGYHMFDAARFDGIAEAFASHESFTLALDQLGVRRFYRSSTWIESRLPRHREAAAMGIALDAPVLVMTYVDVDAADSPILYAHSVMPSHAVRIRVDSD